MMCQSLRTRSPTRAWSRDVRGSMTPSRANTNRTNPAASNPDDGVEPPRRYGIPTYSPAVDSTRDAPALGDGELSHASSPSSPEIEGTTPPSPPPPIRNDRPSRTSLDGAGASAEFGQTNRLIRHRHSPNTPSTLPIGSASPPP